MGRQMKVALELQPCCGRRSGIGTYTYELARRLKNQDGLEFCGNLFNFAGRNDNTAALQGIGMPVRENRVLDYGVYRRIWNLLPVTYQQLFPESDLTVCFDYIVPPRVTGKVMTTLHDLTYIRYPQTMKRRNRRRLERGLPATLERCDHIVAISEFSKREVMELLQVPKEKISVIYGAPSIPEETVPFSKLKVRWNITQPYLLYVGTIEPRKNLVRLLRAFRLLKKEQGIPHQLVLAGGMGWNSKEIAALTEEPAIRESVVLTGYVSGPEKNALYENAHAFLFPSLYEGFGLPPLEAMTFGCPVVCANAASLPEVAGKAAQMVDPMSELSIAEGIWRVLSDEAYSAGLVQLGYEQIKEFSWEASAQRLLETCKAVLEV